MIQIISKSFFFVLDSDMDVFLYYKQIRERTKLGQIKKQKKKQRKKIIVHLKVVILFKLTTEKVGQIPPPPPSLFSHRYHVVPSYHPIHNRTLNRILGLISRWSRAITNFFLYIFVILIYRFHYAMSLTNGLCCPMFVYFFYLFICF